VICSKYVLLTSGIHLNNTESKNVGSKNIEDKNVDRSIEFAVWFWVWVECQYCFHLLSSPHTLTPSHPHPHTHTLSSQHQKKLCPSKSLKKIKLRTFSQIDYFPHKFSNFWFISRSLTLWQKIFKLLNFFRENRRFSWQKICKKNSLFSQNYRHSPSPIFRGSR
jgi:hypothetical protein